LTSGTIGFDNEPRQLERDAKKWVPVFRKNHAKTKTLEHDAILSYRIML